MAASDYFDIYAYLHQRPIKSRRRTIFDVITADIRKLMLILRFCQNTPMLASILGHILPAISLANVQAARIT